MIFLQRCQCIVHGAGRYRYQVMEVAGGTGLSVASRIFHDNLLLDQHFLEYGCPGGNEAVHVHVVVALWLPFLHLFLQRIAPPGL